MHNKEELRCWQDRIRILFILYFFSDDYCNNDYPDRQKVFHTEVRLQKIDFLVRNPDYLSYFLLQVAVRQHSLSGEIKDIVKKIFSNREPVIRKEDMTRFLFGAYENIDNIIAFLYSVNVIDYSSKKDTYLRDIDKHYYITQKGVSKLDDISKFPALHWYKDRCLLIKRFFGNYSGEQLKNMQHNVDQYHQTEYSEVIPDITTDVKEKYFSLYNEAL